MVVLDAVHQVQAQHAPDLAVRWNCKAGRCGSCGAEVNGHPRLMCMDRVDKYPAGEPITVRPMKTFPVIKDLVCDVSWNFEVNKKIPAFDPPHRPAAAILAGRGRPRAGVSQVHRVLPVPERLPCAPRPRSHARSFAGPRFFVRVAGLEMHPLDDRDRTGLLKRDLGIGYCNITKCCTEVCPESIHITDNAIIPLKERVIDEFYDPVKKLFRILLPRSRREGGKVK